MALYTQASAKFWAGNFLQAEQSAREAVDIYRTTTPKTFPDRISAEGLLGQSLLKQGRLEEAEPYIESSYLSVKTAYGPQSSKAAIYLKNFVDLYRMQGNLIKAEDFARQALKIDEAIGIGSISTAASYERLAIVLWRRGKYVEAEKHLRTAIAVYSKTFTSASLYIAALIGQRRYAEAATVLSTALSQLRSLQAPDWRIGRSESALGYALFASGNRTEARVYLEKGYEALSANTQASTEYLEFAFQRLQEFYIATANIEELSNLQSTQAKITAKAKQK
jgi:tetratricopeptide (TPR) repeat protein